MNRATLTVKNLMLGVGITAIVGVIMLSKIYNISYFTVNTGSMEPTLPVGSVIVTQAVHTISVGEIISFISNGAVVTHRVVDVRQLGSNLAYQTKGDANEHADSGVVFAHSIIGKVRWHIPYVGKLVFFSKTLPGYFLLIVLPALYLLISGIRGVKQSLSASAILALFALGLFTPALTQAFFTTTAESTGHTLATDTFFEQTRPLYLSNGYTCESGASENTLQFGTFSLDVEGTAAYLSVAIETATPSSTYDIWVNQYPAACPLSSPTFPTALTTNASGDANGAFEIPIEPATTAIWISVVGGGHVLRSTSVAL